MKFGELIRVFRQKKDLTQEALGDKLGVSPQAVSKWENSDCYPDAELLVPLANALDVSLDVLFLNGKTTERDAAVMIADVMSRTERRERFNLCRRFGWVMETSMFGAPAPEMADLRPAWDPANERGMSAIADETGFTQISNQKDAPYFAVFPKPREGWDEAIGDGEEIRRVFAALGHEPTMRAALFLMRQEYGFLFDAGFLAEKAGIPPEETAAAVENLRMLKLAREQDPVEIDGVPRAFWRYYPNEKILSLMIFARDALYTGYFRYQSQTWTAPLLG